MLVCWLTYWTRHPVAGGMQLDIMYDPAGHGRYGLRTDRLLRTATAGSRYLKLCPEGEVAYLLQKRLRKQDWTVLERLMSDWDQLPVPSEVDDYWSSSCRLSRARLESYLASKELGHPVCRGICARHS